MLSVYRYTLAFNKVFHKGIFKGVIHRDKLGFVHKEDAYKWMDDINGSNSLEFTIEKTYLCETAKEYTSI